MTAAAGAALLHIHSLIGKATVSTVLLTGAAGFIGRRVAAALLAEGRDVLAFDRVGRTVEGCETFLGDVRDATAVTEAMAHADAWIHLAGVLGTAEAVANPLPAAETNVLGGLNVLNAAAQYGLPGVNIAVGNHFENNTYSITKSSVERFCDMYRHHRDLPVTCVRALNAYGPGQSVAAPYGSSKVRKIMPSFVMRALSGDPIQIYGDGQQIMDMVYVRDVADVMVRALRHTEASGGYDGVIEAGTGRHTTVLDIAKAVIAEVGAGHIEHLPMRAGETPGAVVVADTTTLGVVGVDPASLVRLEDGLMPTVKYFRDYAAARA